MDQFQQRYIELKNAYVRSDGDAASVQALYEYKYYLEEQSTLEAKWGLLVIDVCETLELYRTAYETLQPLVMRGDKKAQKRLGRLQGFQEQTIRSCKGKIK